ncbi:MAG: hypothetical protein ACI914_001283 [Candidatus Marivariicella framensis]|jgi:hypothetical protein|tara:strand:+ start:526 stop:1722 length:1197 start_codon:yes stop_codon:yes gene_type:complete
MKKVNLLFCILTLISCTTKEIFIEDIPLSYHNNNAQPNLVSYNGTLSLSWISSEQDNNASLHFSQLKNGKWIEPQKIADGSDWFVNWADFPAHAINEDLILTSYLKKSDSGTYTYDVLLNLRKLTGEKIKEDFLLNTDGVKAEHGFVSIIPNKKGFFVTWLDGRNTIEKKSDGEHKPMTIRFAEISNTGDIINESELDAAACDCCQTSIANTSDGPIVVYRDRSDKEVRDVYSVRNINGVWEDPNPVHNDGWIINGCPVNGPKVASNSKNLAIAWFTASNGNPLVNVSFSKNNGASFDKPIKINDVNAIGRVDIAFLNDDEAIVSYMEVDDAGTYLRIKKVSVNRRISQPITISKIDGGRNTGVPQLEIINNEIFIVWTIFVEGMNQLKSIKLSSKNI